MSLIFRDVAKRTREDVENLLGESVVTKNNNLNYEYVEEKRLK